MLFNSLPVTMSLDSRSNARQSTAPASVPSPAHSLLSSAHLQETMLSRSVYFLLHCEFDFLTRSLRRILATKGRMIVCMSASYSSSSCFTAYRCGLLSLSASDKHLSRRSPKNSTCNILVMFALNSHSLHLLKPSAFFYFFTYISFALCIYLLSYLYIHYYIHLCDPGSALLD